MFDADALTEAVIGALGARVRFSRGAGAPTTLPGVFDRHHAALPLLNADEAPVSVQQTQITFRRGALPFAPRQGDKVEVALRHGTQVDIAEMPAGAVVEVFAVMDVQPDGLGGVLLPLSAWQD